MQNADSQRSFYSHFNPNTNTATILRGDYRGGFYRTGNRFTCAMFGGLGAANFTLGALVAHELIGHGGPVARGRAPASQREAARIENLYHSARGRRIAAIREDHEPPSCNCVASGDGLHSRRRHRRSHRPSATFFSAASHGDSATLMTMSVDSLPVRTALTASRAEPELFRLAAESLTADNATRRADTASIFFRAPRSERIAVGFVKRDTTWLVNHLGFPDRQ